MVSQLNPSALEFLAEEQKKKVLSDHEKLANDFEKARKPSETAKTPEAQKIYDARAAKILSYDLTPETKTSLKNTAQGKRQIDRAIELSKRHVIGVLEQAVKSEKRIQLRKEFYEASINGKNKGRSNDKDLER